MRFKNFESRLSFSVMFVTAFFSVLVKNAHLLGLNPGRFVLAVGMSRWLESRATGPHSCSVALLPDTGQRCHMAQVNKYQHP
jgi:hypothetical protein